MRRDSTTGLPALVAGTVIALAAITSVTAVSKSTEANAQEIAMPANKMNWVPFGEGPVQMVMLWGDMKSGEFALLLKIPPGGTPGPHSHSGDYHGINLQGTWVHVFGDDDIRSLPPGSYVMQPGGELHNDACAGPEECILFIHQHGPFDFIPPEGAGQQ